LGETRNLVIVVLATLSPTDDPGEFATPRLKVRFANGFVERLYTGVVRLGIAFASVEAADVMVLTMLCRTTPIALRRKLQPKHHWVVEVATATGI